MCFPDATQYACTASGMFLGRCVLRREGVRREEDEGLREALLPGAGGRGFHGRCGHEQRLWKGVPPHGP